MFKHTPETDEKIRAGYMNHLPVRVIADELGVTRNVVIGRAGRLGLGDMENIKRYHASDEARETSRKTQIKRWANATPEQRKAIGASMKEGRMRHFKEYREFRALNPPKPSIQTTTEERNE